jgi:hypothetical protein
MSLAYLAQPGQQQKLEWLDGGTLSILLDSAATDGQLMVGRFDVEKGRRRRFTCTPGKTRCSCTPTASRPR